jgi:hypothetical protein
MGVQREREEQKEEDDK